LGPVGPTDKENQVKIYKKKYCYLFETARIRIHKRIKQSYPDPYQIEKQDPDPLQSEKQDLDQKGLDPQH
jgi:hypothetical protein